MTASPPRTTIGTGHGRPAAETQDAIVAYLAGRKSPATVEEIAAAVSLTPRVVAGHLRELRAYRRVQSIGFAPRTWVKASRASSSHVPAPTSAWAKVDAQILAWLEEHDAPATYIEIVQGTGLSDAIVRSHMRAMVTDDRVFHVGSVTEGVKRGIGPSLWLPGPPPKGWTAP